MKNTKAMIGGLLMIFGLVPIGLYPMVSVICISVGCVLIRKSF